MSGYECAVLMQDIPVGKQPLAYYSTKLDKIEGLPSCYQGLAATASTFQKVSSITMGHQVRLFTSHQSHVLALLTSPCFVSTQSQKTGYEVILAAPELRIQRCNTVNPATHLMLPDDGTPHDCVQRTETFLNSTEDMLSQLAYQRT